MVKIRVRQIKNKFPSSNTIEVTLADAKQGVNFTSFDSFTGGAKLIAMNFAASIFADSTSSPTKNLQESLSFTLGMFRLNKNSFRQQDGKEYMTDKEAEKSLKDLRAINKKIVESIGKCNLHVLITLLRKNKYISIGKTKEDVLSQDTLDKIKTEGMIVSTLSDFDRLNKFTGQDYQSGSTKEGSNSTTKKPLGSIFTSFDKGSIIFNAEALKKVMTIKSNSGKINIYINTREYVNTLFKEEGYPDIDNDSFPFSSEVSDTSVTRDEEIEFYEDENNDSLATWIKELDMDNLNPIFDSENLSFITRVLEEWEDPSKIYALIDERLGLTLGNEGAKNNYTVKDAIKDIIAAYNKQIRNLEDDVDSNEKDESTLKMLKAVNNAIEILKAEQEIKLDGGTSLLTVKRNWGDNFEMKDYEAVSLFGNSKTGSLSEIYDFIIGEKKLFSKKEELKNLIRNDDRVEGMNNLQDLIISYLTPINQQLEVGVLDIEIDIEATKKGTLANFDTFEEFMLRDKKYGIVLRRDGDTKQLVGVDPSDKPKYFNEKEESVTYGTRFGETAGKEYRRHKKMLEAITDFDKELDSIFIDDFYIFDGKKFVVSSSGLSNKDEILSMIFPEGESDDKDDMKKQVETTNIILDAMLTDIVSANSSLDKIELAKGLSGKRKKLWVEGNYRNTMAEKIKEDPTNADLKAFYKEYGKGFKTSEYNKKTFTNEGLDKLSLTTVYFWLGNKLVKLQNALDKLSNSFFKIKSVIDDKGVSTSEKKYKILKYNILDLWYDFKDDYDGLLELFEEDELDSSRRLNEVNSRILPKREFAPNEKGNATRITEKIRDKDGNIIELPVSGEIDSEKILETYRTNDDMVKEVPIFIVKKVSFNASDSGKITTAIRKPSKSARVGSSSARFVGTPNKQRNTLPDKDTDSLSAASANYENLVEGSKR